MSVDFYPNSNYFVTSSIVTDFDSGIRFWKIKKKPTIFANPNLGPFAQGDQKASVQKESEGFRGTFEKWEIVH